MEKAADRRPERIFFNESGVSIIFLDTYGIA